MSEALHLTMALMRGAGQTEALRDGAIQPANIALEQINVEPPPMIYRRMLREGAFDIAEMALSTFLCAKSLNKPISALPVFSNRGFSSMRISYNVKAGIQSPRDLEGKRVGMRAYTVTNTTEMRGLLKSEFGVDPNKVTWVVTEDAHVAEYQPPPNVEMAPAGRDVDDMLVAGEVDAALGARVQHADVRPLFTDEEAHKLGLNYFRRTGIYPIGHTVVISDETLAAHPGIAEPLFWAFKAAKDRYLDKLRAGGGTSERDQELLRNRALVGDDPMPYGVPRNRAALQGAIELNLEQRVIRSRLEVDALFAPGTLELEG